MKTLQEFCQSVATDVSGASADDVAQCCSGSPDTVGATVASPAGPLVGLDIMSLITAIGTIITTITQNCPQKSRDLAKTAANPTFRQRVQFRAEASRQLRSNPNFRWRDRHEIVTTSCAKVFGGMSEEDRVAVIEDARTADYSVI
jgi:hypothetical protein